MNDNMTGCHSHACMISPPGPGQMGTNSGKCYCPEWKIRRKLATLEAQNRTLREALEVARDTLCEVHPHVHRAVRDEHDKLTKALIAAQAEAREWREKTTAAMRECDRWAGKYGKAEAELARVRDRAASNAESCAVCWGVKGIATATLSPPAEAPHRCRYCGQLSWVDPSDQSPPADCCQESDHGEPAERIQALEQALSEALGALWFVRASWAPFGRTTEAEGRINAAIARIDALTQRSADLQERS
jgi:hypothetical protein